jgi:serine protease Do
MTRSAVVPLLLLLAPAAVRAEERLWTERAPVRSARTTSPPFVELARSLGPAVVSILAVHVGGEGTDGERRSRGRGHGTGFVLHKSGYLLTNSHVIEGAEEIRVRLSDDRQLSARVVGRDDRTDIALLKIEGAGELVVAPLGDSDALRIGEPVMAIGNPFGLDHSVTAGIVSAKGRRDVQPGGPHQPGLYDFIQTDASINPGNSGGPLINARGEVVGMNTAVNAQAQGIGFAIPSNMLKAMVPLLASHGYAPRSWLGVYPQPITVHLQRAFGLADRRGALLSEVVPDSPAGRAGLEPGDVVLTFDGKPIQRADDLPWIVATTPPGRRVPVSFVRNRGARAVEIELEASSEAPARAAPASAPEAHRSKLGMTVSEVTPRLAEELGQPTLRGVVVMAVEAGSPALEAGVERGDVIQRVGETAVTLLDHYAAAVRQVATGDTIRLLVRRDKRSLWVAFPKR